MRARVEQSADERPYHDLLKAPGRIAEVDDEFLPDLHRRLPGEPISGA